MKVITDLNGFTPDRVLIDGGAAAEGSGTFDSRRKAADGCFSSAIVIGKFDGVHIGHAALLNELMRVTSADDGGMLQSVVFTFSPSPEYYFSEGRTGCLTTDAEKRRLFEKAGVDIVVEFPFNAETASMEPEDFIGDILVDRLAAKYVIAGSDLSFGHEGRGGIAMLEEAGKKEGFRVICLPKVTEGGEPVSSTRIRRLIAEGDIAGANRLLGRTFSFTGEVVHGRQLGRDLGMPTLNQQIPAEKYLPPFGVYFSQTEIDGRLFDGITNIGMKPTVGGSTEPLAETYLYDFHENVYGRIVTTGLLAFRRPERRFSSVDELGETMRQDMAAGRIFHSERAR